MNRCDKKMVKQRSLCGLAIPVPSEESEAVLPPRYENRFSRDVRANQPQSTSAWRFASKKVSAGQGEKCTYINSRGLLV